MSQAVSVPPATQERSAEFAVILEADNTDGDGQEIHELTSIKSMAISPVKEVPLV